MSDAKKVLKMIFGWPRLLLEVVLNNRYALLVRITGFITIAAATGHYGDATGSSLLPLLLTHNAFSGAFDGGFGVAPWWFLAVHGQSCEPRYDTSRYLVTLR
jgi:hypothetical protein